MSRSTVTRSPTARCCPVADGQVVRIGRVDGGLRAYLGVAGGFATPPVFGSRSSDTLSGLGADRSGPAIGLARGPPGRLRGRLDLPAAAPVAHAAAGRGRPRRSTSTAWWRTDWEVGADVDRIGVRLAPVHGLGVDGGPAGRRPRW